MIFISFGVLAGERVDVAEDLDDQEGAAPASDDVEADAA
jgi:hypothetical protein